MGALRHNLVPSLASPSSPLPLHIARRPLCRNALPTYRDRTRSNGSRSRHAAIALARGDVASRCNFRELALTSNDVMLGLVMAARGSALVVLLLAVACSSEGTSPEEAAPSASPGGGGGAPSGGVIPSAGAGSGAEVGAGGLMFSGSGGTGSATPPPGVARSNMPLAEGWRFLRQDAANAQDPAFDDAAWESVTVPHTYNALDGQDGGGDYYRGPTWYRLRFTAPELAGRRAYLGFDAANTVADVYLNGTS